MNIESSRQRHEVEPQQFAEWRIEGERVTIIAGPDKWISAEKVVEVDS